MELLQTGNFSTGTNQKMSSKADTGDKSSSSDAGDKSRKSATSMPIYKTTNPYCQDKRPIYFISDVPQLIKTIRNCWSHSFSHGNTRKLWVSFNHTRHNFLTWILVRQEVRTLSTGILDTHAHSALALALIYPNL